VRKGRYRLSIVETATCSLVRQTGQTLGRKGRPVYFNFRLFFRLLFLSLFRSKKEGIPLTTGRVLWLFFFFVALPLTHLFNVLCFLLDAIFFPKYRNVKLEKPVFIVGNPRSGTTLVHRLLAKDEDQFFFFKTWELMYPAIIQKKFLSFIGRLDRLAGNILGKNLRHIHERLTQDMNKIHPMGLFDPEEDEVLLMPIFSSFNLIWFFPYEELNWFHRFDLAATPQDRRRIMSYYRKCIKREAFFKENRGHFLSKNISFSARIGSLYEYFPECKIIYLVRNPLDAVPSMKSMAHKIWRSTISMDVNNPFGQNVYEGAKGFYTYPLVRLARAPEDSYVIAKYEDLVRKPSKVIRSIYEKFGFSLTSKYSLILEEEDQKAEKYRSWHGYSLEEFGLSARQIIEDFEDAFERFGFDKRGFDSE
jgi:hypothetical protein